MIYTVCEIICNELVLFKTRLYLLDEPNFVDGSIVTSI